jgi:hypothetical protein
MYSGVMQKLKRMLPATVLLLTAGHAVAISDTFTANCDEESVKYEKSAAMGTSRLGQR